MKVEDALYHAVHDYPGGAGSLGPRMGLAASTLYGMANPNGGSHPWPLQRFRQVLALTGDKRPLNALCEENGGVFVPVGAAQENLPGALQQLATLSAEFGDVARHAADAMRDGRITPRELAAFDTQVFELIQAAAGLGMQLRADAEKAAPVRAVK